MDTKINTVGIRSLTKILSKNSEMQMPEKTSYKVLAVIAGLGIMIPCTLIVGFISYVMTEALLEAGSPGGGMLFEMQILSAFSMIFGMGINPDIQFISDKYLCYYEAQKYGIQIVAEQCYKDSLSFPVLKKMVCHHHRRCQPLSA